MSFPTKSAAAVVTRVDLIAEHTCSVTEQSVIFAGLDIVAHDHYRLIASMENADLGFAANVYMLINDDEDRTHYVGSTTKINAPPFAGFISTYNYPLVASFGINERALMDHLIMKTPSGLITHIGKYCTPIAGYGYTTDIPLTLTGQTTFTVANLTKIKLVAMKTTTVIGVGFKAGSKFQLYGYKEA